MKKITFLGTAGGTNDRTSKFWSLYEQAVDDRCIFLNEDRHMHNIAVLMNGKGDYAYCPIFDHGAGLLADTTMDYPLSGDTYALMDQG